MRSFSDDSCKRSATTQELSLLVLRQRPEPLYDVRFRESSGWASLWATSHMWAVASITLKNCLELVLDAIVGTDGMIIGLEPISGRHTLVESSVQAVKK
jgi:hypothetical protein